MLSRNSGKRRDAKMLVCGSVTGSFLSVYYQRCDVNSSQDKSRRRAIEAQLKSERDCPAGQREDG